MLFLYGLFSINFISVFIYVCLISKTKRPADPRFTPLSSIEMRKFILWRSFYVNPEDPRSWVPKVSGFGTTINFRTKKAALIFAGLILNQLVISAAIFAYLYFRC